MSADRISPTAHYTGYTWLAHGLSAPAFATPQGRLFYRALLPANRALAALGQPNLEGLLLARHRLIDALLARAIERGVIGQVIEIACGLSPRGHRFAAKYGPALTYVEADLPAMAARKRALLARLGAGSSQHRVVDVDATLDDGPASLSAIADGLDRDRGVAIVTEGLLNYFPTAAVTSMWRRFAAALGRFPRGLYLADLHTRDATGPTERLFAGLLGAFVRGRVHFHFDDADRARDALVGAGFARAAVLCPADHTGLTGPVDRASARVVRVIDASLGADAE
ncbi:MAG: class I SAM-dependent methyltransferase [Polyangiaceae bacterium]